MQRFHFDRDFDAEIEEECVAAGAARHAAAHPPPSAAEIAQMLAEAEARARAEGFSAGKAEGLAEAEAGQNARIEATLQALLPAITALQESRAAHHAMLERDQLQLIRRLADKILPEIFETLAPRRLAAFSRQALRMAEGKGGLELRLPPALLPQISESLAGLQNRSDAPLRLSADPALDPGSAKALWDQGQADYALAPLYQAVRAALSDLLPHEPGPSPGEAASGTTP